ncbi:MAG: hypothetical protein ASARMPRED_001874 [Alectoria sarmentosa]|nr:MAG: hypothetical protein ASARMPRED_001874 [Alectoria sarmentosa]
MSGNTLSRIPQEVRDLIYTEVVKGGKYIVADPEGWLRSPLGSFHYHELGYHPPTYIGLLLVSKSVSSEMQEILYKEGVFRAYLCRHPDQVVQPPRPQEFARLQKIEIILDVSLYSYTANPINQDLTKDPGHVERHYRKWFEAFGGAGARRDFCRIKIKNIELESFARTLVYRQLLSVFKTLTGFRIVIFELEERLYVEPFQIQYLQPARIRAANGPLKEPEWAGDILETLKNTIAVELQPSLGHCVYYDRGHVSCVELRPRTDEPIEHGCAPYVDDMGN